VATGGRGGDEPPAAEREAGPRLLWFGVGGGAVAWAGHLLAAWLGTELPCARGHDIVLGMGLRTTTALATLVPGVVALAAFLVALRAGRVLRRLAPDRRVARAQFMAQIGAWMDAFALLMILFGGVAVATLSPCAR
jgi:hypothetical protein